MNPDYTFSKMRAAVHIILLLCTAGGWFFFGLIWEMYRMFKK